MKPANITMPPLDQKNITAIQQQQQQQPASAETTNTNTPPTSTIPLLAPNAVGTAIATTTPTPTPPPLVQPPPQQQQQLTPIESTIQVPSTPTGPTQIVPQLVSGQGRVGPQVATAIRPNGEQYLVLLSPNPRQPGVQNLRYPMAMGINQPGILTNSALIRSINASQLVRPPISSSVLQTQTSQAQTTTTTAMPGGPVQIPFNTAGARGPITLANGQTIMPSAINIPRHQMMPRATILQTPTLIRGVTQQGLTGHPTVIPSNQPMTLGMQAPMGSPMIHQSNLFNAAATAIAPSQMTPEDALAKGTSFFNSLLTKMTIKDKKPTLENLIQALIDGKKTSAEFASALQKELNSGPQTQLVPFLDLLLPHLRLSISSGVTKLPGIRPPPTHENSSTLPQVDSSLTTTSPNKVQSNNAAAAKKKKVPLPPGQKSAYAIKKEAREARKKEREILAAQALKTEGIEDKKEPDKIEKPTKPKTDKSRRQDKQKKQEKQLESLSSSLRDDDDVNDVAAMGGVNLAEESQRIMAFGAELVGTQIRSCKDEPFLDVDVLSNKIARIAKEHNLPEPSKDVITIISHATQERLKNIVEKLGILAEHRSENLRLNPKYEASNDIKGQMKFIAELDRIEKRRYEEQERELLLRVAKSRSKVEDPEQQKLRQKAKDMQRAEQEEVRQREANETALLAIGPRKKLKTGSAYSSSTVSSQQPAALQDVKPVVDNRSDTNRRIKRVNMKDLQILFELDRTQLNRLIKITIQ